MDCYFFAIAGIALLSGSVMTLSISEKQRSKISKVFSKEIADKYERIVMERTAHYLIGLFMGFLLAFILIFTYDRPLSYFYHITFFLTITLGTALLVYFLMPKTDYIRNYLKTPKEVQEWNKIENEMLSRYILGFFLGILAAILFASVLC